VILTTPRSTIVRSKDWTAIGYQTLGVGAGLQVVGGASRTGQGYLPLARALAPAFTVQLQPYFGFHRQIAPGGLYRSQAHQEARARIGFLISQGALGLICGEVGAGKTCAARAAVAGLDRSRHTIIYLANPAVGTRGV
jgi:hypothetical protein